MKPRNIKLTVGTRLKPTKQRRENAGSRPASPAMQAPPNGSAPAPKVRPLLASRWGINDPQPSPASHPASAAEPAEPTEPAEALAGPRPVRFELFAPDARAVFVAGSLNKWNPSATPMTRSGEGKWGKELWLPSGRYEYQFVVDGRWTPDLKAADEMPNPFGGFNSVVEVPPSS
jgi:hypothetical protein